MSRSLPRISLRRINSGLDEQILFHWRNDERVYRWCRQYDVLHADQHKRWIGCQEIDQTVSMYAVESIDEKECFETVGVCGLTSIDYVNSRAEFSLYIAPGHQGQGFGEAALRALLAKAFFTYNLNLVWGEAFNGNPAMKMFERVGFIKEGSRRQFYYRNGKYIDAHLFSITRNEYALGSHRPNDTECRNDSHGLEDGSEPYCGTDSGAA